jgi:CubicO group peptidase (beta-lactamase class C family)
MGKRHIPGAVLAVAHRGRVVLVGGFGFADLESQRPVDPDRTRFYLASATKVVTATAALQLVERGQLDLTADVNTRLGGFQLPLYRGSSVTLHDLLTDTAGFEERLTGIVCRSEREREPLATYLAKSMPHRFARSGEGAVAVACSVAVVAMWRDRRHRFVPRMEYTMVCAALLAFVPFTVYWRLMGIQT